MVLRHGRGARLSVGRLMFILDDMRIDGVIRTEHAAKVASASVGESAAAINSGSDLGASANLVVLHRAQRTVRPAEPSEAASMA